MFCEKCSCVLDIQTSIELDEKRANAEGFTKEVLEGIIKRVPEIVREEIARVYEDWNKKSWE